MSSRSWPCCSALPSPTHKSRFRRRSAELSVDQIRVFLKDAKVIRTRGTEKGVTAPKRLTLTDGTITHDAVFQAIDERKMVADLGGGGRQSTTELNFVDSYKYNIAAYEIARLLGLDHMMPVYIERRWNGQIGSISWFVPTLMDESERLKKKIQPPNPTDWNNQMYRMRVFSSLVRDTDRNLTNVLITHQWKVMMIDFSRAFRLQPELLHLKDLAKIDRSLLAKLESLTRETSATGDQGFPEQQRARRDDEAPRHAGRALQETDRRPRRRRRFSTSAGGSKDPPLLPHGGRWAPMARRPFICGGNLEQPPVVPHPS